MIVKSQSMFCECTDTENQENKREKVNIATILLFRSRRLGDALKLSFGSTVYRVATVHENPGKLLNLGRDP